MEIIFISILRILAIICQLGYIKLYTVYLTKYDLGIYFFLSTVSYFLNALVFIPVDYYQQSKVYYFLKNNISFRVFLYFNKILLLLILGIAGLCSSVFLFINKTAAFYIVIATLMAIAFYVITALKNTLNNLEYKRITATIFLVEAASKMVFFYLVVQFVKADAVVLFVSNIVALAFVVTIVLFIFKKLNVFKVGEMVKLNYREIFNFSYPISLGAVGYWLQMQGFRLFFTPLGFVELVGVYSTLSQIGISGMNAVSTIYGQIFIPNVYKTSGGYTKTYIRNAMFVIGFIFLVSCIFSDFIVGLITKAEFVKYSKVILFGVANESITFISAILVIYLTIKSETRKFIKTAIISAVTMWVILGFIYFSKIVTIYSVGLPILISQIVGTIYLYNIYRRKTTEIK